MKTQLTDPFHALSDPNRRQILQLLTKDRLTINELAGNFEMSRPAVSKHIKILQTAGFIAIEEIGRERHCVLKQAGFRQVQEWIEHFDSFWQNKLGRLAELMEEKKPVLAIKHPGKRKK